MKKHILIGFAAALLLLFIYSGIITWLQGVEHILLQARQLWYWILALAAGFGIQAGLFSALRQGIRLKKTRSPRTTAAMAASGSVSTGSMIACCAHHISDVLPLLGISGAAIFVVKYQLFFIIAGVLSNIIGITIMLDTMQHCGLSTKLDKLPLNLGHVKKVTIASSLLILAGAFLTIYGQGVFY
jgi:hypothetical protein